MAFFGQDRHACRSGLPFTAGLRACDTPVYRYAMYRWLPAPYEVYCIHDRDLNASASELKSAIDQSGQNGEAPMNIVFVPVDLAADKELARVPPDVKEAWLRQASPALPWYLVSSPVGVHLQSGAMSVDELAAMTDSPARRRIGRLLEEGNAGVYVFLAGADAEATAAAEQELQGVVDDVAAGKITLYGLPPARGQIGMPDKSRAETEPAGPPPLAVGLVKLTRSDHDEKWLVQCLLALERDLPASKEPVVFLVYGRGRALFSCLGKGIRRDNLIQDIEFVTGACLLHGQGAESGRRSADAL